MLFIGTMKDRTPIKNMAALKFIPQDVYYNPNGKTDGIELYVYHCTKTEEPTRAAINQLYIINNGKYNGHDYVELKWGSDDGNRLIPGTMYWIRSDKPLIQYRYYYGAGNNKLGTYVEMVNNLIMLELRKRLEYLIMKQVISTMPKPRYEWVHQVFIPFTELKDGMKLDLPAIIGENLTPTDIYGEKPNYKGIDEAGAYTDETAKRKIEVIAAGLRCNNSRSSILVDGDIDGDKVNTWEDIHPGQTFEDKNVLVPWLNAQLHGNAMEDMYLMYADNSWIRKGPISIALGYDDTIFFGDLSIYCGMAGESPIYDVDAQVKMIETTNLYLRYEGMINESYTLNPNFKTTGGILLIIRKLSDYAPPCFK